MPSQNLHVVLGAGQIGTLVAERLVARGHRVRQVRRGTSATTAGVELMAGDIRDPAFAARAGDGAEVVYHCMNPRYWQWDELLAPLAEGAIAAAAGARLVVLDNLYPYGPPSGPFTETTPIAPNSHKGELRAKIRTRYLEAGAAIGRASDFFGPGIVEAHLGDRFWKRILAGKSAECFGDPDLPHSFGFSIDVADGLITLGERGATGEWMLPHAPAPTIRELVAMLGAAVGVDAKVARVPGWLVKVAGVFSKELRELPEMSYQWEAPFAVDSGKFTREFGSTATPMRRAVELTATWARGAYLARAAA